MRVKTLSISATIFRPHFVEQHITAAYSICSRPFDPLTHFSRHVTTKPSATSALLRS